MQIIKSTTPTARSAHRCDLCGEEIRAGARYSYLGYRLDKSLRSLKCHNDCLSVAQKLKLLERPSITAYSFDRQCRKYLILLHKRGGMRITAKTVDTYPISHIVPLICKYFDELEAEQKKRLSRECVKESISLYVTILMMPYIFDDLIASLERERKYSHRAKFVINKALKEFEIMSAYLWTTYQNDPETADDLIASSLEVYEEIQEQIGLEGTERSANIAMALIDTMRKKYQFIGKEAKVNDQITHLDRIEKHLKEVLTVKRYDFVNFIIDQKCSSKDINLTD